jgi:hypothetical protein
MKAISLWQPWASLIACGAKPYETRHWAPPRDLIGQPIAIHAAKKIDKQAARFAEELMYGQHQPGGFDLARKLDASMSECTDLVMGTFGMAVMPIGCVVAIARLAGAFQLGTAMTENGVTFARPVHVLAPAAIPETFVITHDDFGDYAPGRWAWLLEKVQPLNPCPPAKGAQGFFELPQGWMDER